MTNIKRERPGWGKVGKSQEMHYERGGEAGVDFNIGNRKEPPELKEGDCRKCIPKRVGVSATNLDGP